MRKKEMRISQLAVIKRGSRSKRHNLPKKRRGKKEKEKN
jgi:hypothetical protein